MDWISVEEALHEVRVGRPLVVTDDAERENEGDLVVAAEHATPEVVNFMVTHGRGLVCVALRPERLRALGLPQMVEENTGALATAFTVSVDARRGTTTGISAFDRARTIEALIDPRARPEDLLRPGHVFPLEARPQGVLERPGHTEAAVDLTCLAGLGTSGAGPAGVICEILDDDGDMARGQALADYARRHGLKMLAIAELVRWRRAREARGPRRLDDGGPRRAGPLGCAEAAPRVELDGARA